MKKILLSIIIIGLTGCLNTVVTLNSSPKEEKYAKKIMYPSLGLGMIELNRYQSMISECKDTGVNTVHIYRTALDSTIHFLIGGIYTSRSVDIHCGKK